MNNDNAAKDEPKHCHSYNLRPSKKRNLKSEKLKKFHVESNENDKDLDIFKLVNDESNFNPNDSQKVDNETNVDTNNSQVGNFGGNSNLNNSQLVNSERNVKPNNNQVEIQRNKEIASHQNPQPNENSLADRLIHTGDRYWAKKALGKKKLFTLINFKLTLAPCTHRLSLWGNLLMGRTR